jgi:secreted trypsin-like serine protease
MRAAIFATLIFVLLGRAGATPLPSASALSGATESDPYNLSVRNYRYKPVQQIVGGEHAKSGEFPWQVSLGVSYISDPHWAHFCGGTLFRSDWVITAAHCVIGLKQGDLTVAAGILKLTPGITKYTLDRDPLIKPGYKKGSNSNDVALLHLKLAIPSSSSIQTIDLISDAIESTFVNEKTIFTASGWGSNEPIGLTVASLLKVDLPFVSTDQCASGLSYPPDPISHKPQITTQMLCAGFPEGKADTCQGDSGGPLIFNENGHAKLVGVASWGGYPCAQPYKYGVYSRLSQYRTWLEESVRP